MSSYCYPLPPLDYLLPCHPLHHLLPCHLLTISFSVILSPYPLIFHSLSSLRSYSAISSPPPLSLDHPFTIFAVTLSPHHPSLVLHHNLPLHYILITSNTSPGTPALCYTIIVPYSPLSVFVFHTFFHHHPSPSSF